MDGSTGVWILGGYQSDFARNLTKEGRDFASLTAEVEGTLAAAKLDATDIGVVHVGNAFGEMFAGQGHLGAMPATVRDKLWDAPASRHEAACASGSVAALSAMAECAVRRLRHRAGGGHRAGEKTVTPPPSISAPPRGPDAKAPAPATSGRRCSPKLPTSTVGASAWTTRICAPSPSSTSPTRGATPTPKRAWTVPNPITEGRLRRFDYGQMTDGGAGLVLVDDRYLREHPAARPIGRIDGWGHRTVGLGLRQKLDRAADDRYVLPHVRAAVHDCCTPSEYLAVDRIGLTSPGGSWKATENGEIEVGGGHPVGASGVRMLLDAANQVSGGAGDCQADDARTFGTLNLGGSTATTVGFVVSPTREW